MAKILDYREMSLADLLVDRGQVGDPARPKANQRLDCITY